MGDVIRHSRAVSPYFIPNKGGSNSDFHGITTVSSGATVSSNDIYVVGKSTKCTTDVQLPVSKVSITQLERGEISTFLTLANKSVEPGSGLALTDFSSALIDVALYERDGFEGTVQQTYWYPQTAINSLSFNISAPDALIERKFELGGDNEKPLNYNNKFLIYKTVTAGSGVSGSFNIVVSDPVPVIDPNNSGKYILRIDRIRSGDFFSPLIEGTDFTYNNGTTTITITAALTGDKYEVYYSASSFGGPGDPTSVDSASPCILKGSMVTVLIDDGVTELELDLLTTLALDITFNRLDENVIGKNDRILREIQTTPVTLKLSGRIKDSTFAEAFMGKLGQSHGISDVKLFKDNVKVTVKVYSDINKTTFLLGYQVESLAFTDDTFAFNANDFGTVTVSMKSDNCKITADEGNL